MNQKIIFIEWPSCAGKSTLTKSIIDNNSNFFHISKDKIKWLISDYSRENKTYIKLLQDILEDMAIKALSSWMNLIIESREKLEKIIKWDYEIYHISIEADFKDLEQRLKERVLDSGNTWVKLSNSWTKRLKEIYNIHDQRKKKWLILNSSSLSKKEIYEEAKKYCRLP